MFTLPTLPYGYDALEPFIDTETMQIHYDKHHAGYIKNLNDALVGNEDLLNMDVNKLLKNLDKVPEEIRTKVRNNAGGHSNHTFFWKIMCSPDKSGKPLENILALRQEFDEAALKHFGSGWAWMVLNEGKLEVVTTPNQDSPITDGKTPILGLDVWEHAYYLKYRNMRADYINAFWNIINWKQVEKNFIGFPIS